jgi:hypothetical protein
LIAFQTTLTTYPFGRFAGSDLPLFQIALLASLTAYSIGRLAGSDLPLF